MATHNIVEAHCYDVDTGKLILSMYVAESIQLDCRTFDPHRLRLLCTKLYTPTFCTQLKKAYRAETDCNQVVIDSATYLLKITSPLWLPMPDCHSQQ